MTHLHVRVVAGKIYMHMENSNEASGNKCFGNFWSGIPGARSNSRKLYLRENEVGLYHCPVVSCDHIGFKSKRGCRKHIDQKHPWYYYFDEQPVVAASSQPTVNKHPSSGRRRADTAQKPRFSIDNGIGKDFSIWLCAACGGGMSTGQAKQIATRVMKFLKYCSEDDEDDLSSDFVDYCLGSPSFITKFVEHIKEEWKLGSSAQISYLQAISDMIDYRKSQGVSAITQKNFTIAEIYICRGKRTLTKRKWSEWSEGLAIENLEAMNAWATLEELQQVIPHHSPRFTEVLEKCKRNLYLDISSHDLTFATRFLSVYLFIHVKGSRPVTYQYLTVEMFEKSKISDGFVDQTEFKTAQQYTFDSLIFDEKSTELVDSYIRHVRPWLQPKCNYLLVTRNGTQYSKLSDLMSKLVYEAIGKHIHPTRYRQIVETESAAKLSVGEQDIISRDQKHSSFVARTYYQKISSRDVAVKARQCMEKLKSQTEPNTKVSRCEETPTSEPAADIIASSSVRLLKCNNDDLLATQRDRPKRKVQIQQSGAGKIRRRISFTSEEDRAILQGINKYGFGSWTAIRRDPDLRCLETRNSDSIRKRAKMLKYKT